MMKKDKLERYIKEHREEFDSDEPSTDLWDDISTALDGQSDDTEAKSTIPWRLVAGIALLVGLVSLIMNITDNGGGNGPVLSVDPRPSEFLLADISTEMAEVEIYYSSMLDTKTKKLDRYEVDEELLEEMESLKEEFESLKKEMGSGINDSRIVEALIDNYRLRLSLLEDLLEAFEKSERKENNNEKVG